MLLVRLENMWIWWIRIWIWIRNTAIKICMWQLNNDGLPSLLDVAELLGVRGLKSDRSQRHGSADPDPHQNVMDPEHWLK